MGRYEEPGNGAGRSLGTTQGRLRDETDPSSCAAEVLDQVLEVGKIIDRYEELAAELLAWIHRTVGLIGNQKFANSLSGVQQQLQAFTAYCTLEKPVK